MSESETNSEPPTAKELLSRSIANRIAYTSEVFERRREELGVEDRWFLNREDLAAVNRAGRSWFEDVLRDAAPPEWGIKIATLPVRPSRQITRLTVTFTA